MIPLGLYRTEIVDYNCFKEEDGTKSGAQMRLGKGTLPGENKNENFREIKYVITNPKRSIKLRADDLVFVLSQTDPSDSKTWDDDNLDSENFDTEIDIDFDGDRNLG